MQQGRAEAGRISQFCLLPDCRLCKNIEQEWTKVGADLEGTVANILCTHPTPWAFLDPADEQMLRSQILEISPSL